MPKPIDLRDLDALIHSPARLAIMAMLANGDQLEFTLLKERLELTDGNLSTHMRKLENAGYVKCLKSFLARRPRTSYRISPRGRAAFERHIRVLEQVVNTSVSSRTEKVDGT